MLTAGALALLSRCHSDQVANDPDTGNQFMYGYGAHATRQLSLLDSNVRSKPSTTSAPRHQAWLHVAFSGKDQLRQRVAWALSQIFVVNDEASANTTPSPHHTPPSTLCLSLPTPLPLSSSLPSFSPPPTPIHPLPLPSFPALLYLVRTYRLSSPNTPPPRDSHATYLSTPPIYLSEPRGTTPSISVSVLVPTSTPALLAAGVAPGGFLTHLLPGVPQALGNGLSENALVYYDIFVRHAFTNYRDVMKEVSHSYAMGTMLSFKDARSFKSSGFYPDENYAREIMQLFTMGLWHLHDNGTKVLDAKGQPIATYVQDDVVNFARAWTGFVRHPPRANLERDDNPTTSNTIDPLKLQMSHRDTFPRTDLVGGQYCQALSPSSPALPHHKTVWVWCIVRSAGTGPSNTRNSFAATVIYALTAASFPI